jgi:mRNA-degrading endonuclease RelE of RelBE toxin-antitoxin system
MALGGLMTGDWKEMATRHEIEFSSAAKAEFDGLRTFDQRRIADAISKKLTFVPDVETQGRKFLGDEFADFGYDPPLWELRVAGFRVFYVVAKEERTVLICAVRQKPPHWTTSRVLNEDDRN